METLTRLPWMAQNAVFQRLSQIADISALTREERLKYDEYIKQYRDAINVYNSARQIGREEGRAEGRAEGREEGILLTARNMKAQGLSIDLIKTITGLGAEAIEALEL